MIYDKNNWKKISKEEAIEEVNLGKPILVTCFALSKYHAFEEYHPYQALYQLKDKQFCGAITDINICDEQFSDTKDICYYKW